MDSASLTSLKLFLIYFIAYAIIIETIIVLCSFQFLPASLFSISPNLAFSHLVQSWTLTQEAFLNYLVTSGHRLIFKGKVLKKKKIAKGGEACWLWTLLQKYQTGIFLWEQFLISVSSDLLSFVFRSPDQCLQIFLISVSSDLSSHRRNLLNYWLEIIKIW